MCKKFLSLLLSLIILVGAVGVPVEADDSSSTTPEPTIEYVTITLKPNGGTPNINQEFAVEKDKDFTPKDISTLDPPLKAPTGKKFLGWARESFPNTKLNFPIKADSNITLIAMWTDDQYTVSFNLNGGDGTAPSPITVTYNGTYGTLPDAPTRNGYKFDGWYTDQTGGTEVSSKTKVTTDKTHSLYAHWLALHTITFDPSGGTLPDSDKTKTFVEGERFSLPSPTKPGSTFVGWFDNSDNQLVNNSIVPATMSSTAYKAKYTNTGYTIQLNTAGGSALDISEFTMTYDQTYANAGRRAFAQIPTREGYKFAGWYTTNDDTGKQLADADGNLTNRTTKYGDIKAQTIYAHWEANIYTLTYDYAFPDGAAWKPSATRPSNPTEPSNATYGSAYPTLPSPSAADIPYYDNTSTKKYTFDGWYDEKEDKVDSTDPTNPDKNVTGHKITGGKNGDTYNTVGNQELYARWGYNIEFYANNSGDVTKETVYGTMPCVTGKAYDTSKKPSNPKKTGYNFTGWFDTPTGGNKVELSADSIANGSVNKLYAHWENARYTVTLDPNGGKLADNLKKITVEYGKNYPNIKVQNVPIQSGYKFIGWYTSAEGGTEVTSSTEVKVTDDKTILYAHWEPKPYTVTLNYGNLADSSYKPPVIELKNIYMGASFAGLPDKSSVDGFEKDGVKFTFYNWYTKAEGGNMVNSTSTLSSEMLYGENVTLYARWNYDVEFYYNNTTAKDPKADTKLTFTTGAKYDAFPTPTYTGKTLLGWFTEKEGGTQVSPSGTANGDIFKLYAHWTTSTYVITLDANGGTPGSGAKSWPYNYGDTYGSNITDSNYYPIPPAGHSFEGWYTEAEGGTKVLPTDKVTQTCTLYAHWKPDQFKITLELNYTGSTGTVKTVDYGTKLADVLTPDPERTGFAFDGWFTEKECENLVDKEQSVNSDMTLYAKWTKAKRVELVVGGGTLPEGVPAYVNLYEGGVYRLPTPTWLGCDFDGWYTAETGGTQIQNGTPILTESSIPDTLYARWTPKKVRVNFNYNGPGTTREPKEYPVGSKYTLLPNAMWAGYKFMGWYTKPVGGDKITADTVVSVASDRPEDLEITIYAHWGYTVAFEPGEGSGSMDQEVAEINQPYTLPTCTFTPPDGMRFGGWAIGTPEGATQPGGSQYTVTRNLTLYATWTTAPIVITSSCTSGGSLMTDDGKANSITVERGEDVTFIATANTGYVLKDLVVDGVSFNYTDVYTFRNVIEDHTIHAVFEPIGAPSYTTCDHGNSCPLSRYSDLDPDKWYHNGVHYCIDNVIMSGSSSTRFNPGARSSRGEIAVSLWNNAGRPEYSNRGPLANTYPDVKPSDWYYQAIEWASDEGFLTGYGSGRFGPADSVTREQLVTILWRHAGRPRPRSTTLRFNDASQVSNFAWEAMCWATEQHILQGRSTGYLVPKGTATRAEVATMLMNYLG